MTKEEAIAWVEEAGRVTGRELREALPEDAAVAEAVAIVLEDLWAEDSALPRWAPALGALGADGARRTWERAVRAGVV